MKKREAGGGQIGERVKRLLTDLAAESDPLYPGVRKYTGKLLKFTAAADEGFMFTAAAAGGGVEFAGVLTLEEFAARLLPFFEKIAETRDDVPPEDYEAFAEDRAAVVLIHLLSQVSEAMGDALDLLAHEALAHAGHAEQHTGAGGSSLCVPLMPADQIEYLTRHAERALKRRMGVREQGESSVSWLNLVLAVEKHGGEDAKAKDVAGELGITPRQLRNLREQVGFDSWADLVGEVARFLERSGKVDEGKRDDH